MDCDTPVVLTDLFHTLVAATGLSKPADLPPDGLENFASAAQPERTARSRRALLSLPALLSRSAFHARQHRARAGDWKLVEFFEDERVELYNLRDDLAEQHDLAKAEPGRAAELRSHYPVVAAVHGTALPSPNPDLKRTP